MERIKRMVGGVQGFDEKDLEIDDENDSGVREKSSREKWSE